MSTTRFRRLLVLIPLMLSLASEDTRAGGPTPWERYGACLNIEKNSVETPSACLDFSWPNGETEEDAFHHEALRVQDSATGETEGDSDDEDFSIKQINTVLLEYGSAEIDDPTGLNSVLEIDFWRMSYNRALLRKKNKIDRIYLGVGPGLYNVNESKWGLHTRLNGQLQLTKDPGLSLSMTLIYNWLDSERDFFDWQLGLHFRFPKK